MGKHIRKVTEHPVILLIGLVGIFLSIIGLVFEFAWEYSLGWKFHLAVWGGLPLVCGVGWILWDRCLQKIWLIWRLGHRYRLMAEGSNKFVTQLISLHSLDHNATIQEAEEATDRVLQFLLEQLVSALGGMGSGARIMVPKGDQLVTKVSYHTRLGNTFYIGEDPERRRTQSGMAGWAFIERKPNDAFATFDGKEWTWSDWRFVWTTDDRKVQPAFIATASVPLVDQHSATGDSPVGVLCVNAGRPDAFRSEEVEHILLHYAWLIRSGVILADIIVTDRWERLTAP